MISLVSRAISERFGSGLSHNSFQLLYFTLHNSFKRQLKRSVRSVRAVVMVSERSVLLASLYN